MNVFFYSIKWGQGKTTHAVGYAKHCGATLITNDLDNGTADIYEPILGADHIVTLEPGQSLAGLVKKFWGRDLVFDFGGFVESRIIEAAGMADAVVVPLCYQSTADLMPAVKTVTTLLPHCANIAVLINNTEAAHISGLKAVLANRFPGTPVLVINHSRYLGRLADDGLTVFDLVDLGSLNRFHLRHILPQVRDLYAWLDAARR